MVAAWTTASVIVTALPLYVVILIGTFGNLMVILISARGNRLRTKGRALIQSVWPLQTLWSLQI